MTYSGAWDETTLDRILLKASGLRDIGKRMDFLSGHFLSVPYKESTLIGSFHVPEEFVINLEGVDCFTFIDYIEAMRMSASVNEFREQLKKVRYQSGKVSYENRNHFFTDWAAFNSGFVQDVTAQIGNQRAVPVKKVLNRKEDGALFLEGIQARERALHYIPSESVDKGVVDALETGDYIGIYSKIQGLDVSHVGVFIEHGTQTCLRHASSVKEHRKVVDQDFKNYLSGKPGIIVLRPK